MKNAIRVLMLFVAIITSNLVMGQEATSNKQIEIANETISNSIKNDEVKKKCEPGCKKACCTHKNKDEVTSSCDSKKKKCKKACKKRSKKLKIAS